MPDTRAEALVGRPPGKPFPRHCPHCGQQAVWPAFVPYQGQIRYEGRLHTVDMARLNVPRCEACGELYFDNWADDQIRLALRDKLHLLCPGQLRANRETLGLSRQELATRVGVEEEALRRWEEEASLPPRVADNLLRVYFALPPVRTALLATPHPELGACVTSQAIATSSE